MISIEKQNLFKWKHYQPDIILLTVRWYLRYNLSFRNLVEMMEERGLSMAHTTIIRWVHQYGPELDKRVRRHLKPTNDSWRVDKTYIKVKGQWMYLFAQKNGKPIQPTEMARNYRKLVDKSGLPYIRFHDLRHTHATLLLQQGVHPKVVSERLGHSTIGITMDTYTQVLPNMQKEAAQQFERLLK